jgi:uncharacterized membrane protein
MYQDIKFNSGAISPGECMSVTWNYISHNYWLFFGMSLLTWVITACIPCVNVVVVGPIMVGLYYAYLRQMNGEYVEFGMMFKGFEKFVPAMVVGLIQSIPGIVGQGVQYTTDISTTILNQRRSGSFLTEGSFAMQSAPEFALSGGLLVVAIIVGLIVFLFGIAWYITFFFALPILSEYDLGIGETIALSARAGWSNWGGLILLFIFQFLAALVGVLLLCIGVFFVLPIIFGSTATAYRQVFPRREVDAASGPPAPDYFGGGFGTAR